jgi:peptide methionine sulfoxide reductase msrA/msrB
MNKILLVFLAISFASCAQTNTPKVTTNNSSMSTPIAMDTAWTAKVVKTNAEWKKILTPQQYEIAREYGTEHPFTSEWYENHETGVYFCVACNNPLFSSTTKFNSGTGWPSYYAPLSSKSVGVNKDNSMGMERDEVHCLRCDAHLGHVFDDGPKPTGLRYCIDGVGLTFQKVGTETGINMKKEMQPSQNETVATFAGGCFWCEEAVFESIKGVREVISGYSGGKEKTPTYETVGAGETGHAESFEVYYDPSKVNYKDLVRVYLASIDPTQVAGQGPDHGKQYRSIAFYRNDMEKKLIDEAIAQLTESGKYKRPIVVEVTPYTFFVKAEDYHQNYVQLHPENPYVQQESLPRRKRTLEQVKDLLK